jgi:hypothetical protein
LVLRISQCSRIVELNVVIENTKVSITREVNFSLRREIKEGG